MNQAMKNNEDCVYISLGSECKWLDWEAKAFTDGIEKLNDLNKEANGRGVRAIISFRTKEFKWPVENSERFWVSDWTP